MNKIAIALPRPSTLQNDFQRQLELVLAVNPAVGIALPVLADHTPEQIAASLNLVRQSGLQISALHVLPSASSPAPLSLAEQVQQLEATLSLFIPLFADTFPQPAKPLLVIDPQWFTYPTLFNTDYGQDWNLLVQTVQSAAERLPAWRLALGHGASAHRAATYLSHASKVFALLGRLPQQNIGISFAPSQAIAAQENPAEAACLFLQNCQLFDVQWGDYFSQNLQAMPGGSIHFLPLLEMLYWLQQYAYDGWFTVTAGEQTSDIVESWRTVTSLLIRMSDLLRDERFQEKVLELRASGNKALRAIFALILGH